MVQRQFRALVRLARFLKYSTDCVADFNRVVRPHETTGKDHRRRAEWIHRNAKRLCRLMNWQVMASGSPPQAALYCANHVGYLDIVTLGATTPVAFVSKAEVKNWPVLGRLAEYGGTLFLDRTRRAEVASVASQFEPVIQAGVPIVVFLEGTSSSGENVLPFRSSLLQPAVAAGWKVAPVGLDYAVEGGVVAEDVAYWGNMTFGPHFFGLLGFRQILARVSWGSASDATDDRKTLAEKLRTEVVRLRQSKNPGV